MDVRRFAWGGRVHLSLAALVCAQFSCRLAERGSAPGESSDGGSLAGDGAADEPPDCAGGGERECACTIDPACCASWDDVCDSVVATFDCTRCSGGPAPSGADPDGEDVDPAGAAPACVLSGQHAVLIRALASTDGSTFFGFPSVAAASNRTAEAVLLLDVKGEGGSAQASVRVCSAGWPDFASSLGEHYGVVLPTELYDRLDIRWPARLTSTCSEEGCTLDTEPLVVQLGTSIDTASPWPSPTDPVDSAALGDEDRDGFPGVLARARGPRDPGEVKYVYPPVSPLMLSRVMALDVAFRFTAALHGPVAGCEQGVGTADGVSLSARVYGCRLEGGQRCTSGETSYVDGNVPLWTLTSGTFVSARLADGADCRAARAAVAEALNSADRLR
jgi:hypothetical protein